jgi:hypothetical protein
VIRRRDGQIRAAHATIRNAQSLKRLRRSHFMNEMQIDVKESGLIFRLADYVRVPKFFK